MLTANKVSSSIQPLSSKLVKKIKIKSSASRPSDESNISQDTITAKKEFQTLKVTFPHFFKNISDEVISFEQLTSEQQKEVEIFFQKIRTGIFPIPKNVSEKINSLKSFKVSEEELLNNLVTYPTSEYKILQKETSLSKETV